MYRRSLSFAVLVLALVACVPKTQYEDQQQELTETKAELKNMKQTKAGCDPDAYLEMKNQAQSLDILQQELIDRNTQLAQEVARLRVYETEVKNGDLTCDKKMDALRQDFEDQLKRTRETDQDLIADLRKQVNQKNQQIAAYQKRLSDLKSSSIGEKPVSPKTKLKTKAGKTKPAPKKQKATQ